MSAGRCTCGGSTEAPCWHCTEDRTGCTCENCADAIECCCQPDRSGFIADAEERAFARGQRSTASRPAAPGAGDDDYQRGRAAGIEEAAKEILAEADTWRDRAAMLRDSHKRGRCHGNAKVRIESQASEKALREVATEIRALAASPPPAAPPGIHPLGQCECGHPVDRHQRFSDHDECRDCRGDDPCCHLRCVPGSEGWVRMESPPAAPPGWKVGDRVTWTKRHGLDRYFGTVMAGPPKPSKVAILPDGWADDPDGWRCYIDPGALQLAEPTGPKRCGYCEDGWDGHPSRGRKCRKCLGTGLATVHGQPAEPTGGEDKDKP